MKLDDDIIVRSKYDITIGHPGNITEVWENTVIVSILTIGELCGRVGYALYEYPEEDVIEVAI